MITRDVHARARDIRAGLPRQLRHYRLKTASLLYGPLYDLDEVHRQIARTLPFRFGCVRRVQVVPIERSDTFIPDEVLLRYDEAVQAGVFGRFLIATPAYYWSCQGDAWLIGVVDGTTQWAILARWTDAGRPPDV
jgi:hypothetical protein